MRVLLLLLVAANLLAFAWGQGWLIPIIGDVRQPERMGRQVGPDRLRVLGPGDSAGTERAVAGRVESDESTRPSARHAPHSARSTTERAGTAARGASPSLATTSSPAASARDGDHGGGQDDFASRDDVVGSAATQADRSGNRERDGERNQGASDSNAVVAGKDGAGLRAMLPPSAPSTLKDLARPSVADAAAAPESPPSPAAAPGAASAPPAPAAPAVPFGLAEPPLTDALASEGGRRSPALRAAAPQGTQPDQSPAPDRPAPALSASSGPAPLASAAVQACFDLRGLDRVGAEAARDQLEGMGAVSVEELSTENRSGYIVYLPPFESAELAQARIEQLRGQGVQDIYLILDGTYRLAISLGVFNRMESVELQLERLRARGVEDAEIGFVNPAATRLTLRVRGPEDRMDEAQMRAMANLRGAQLARCP